eukprot:gnl/MRDRNA2_/MRDRNA2_35719_c0_seq1.p1 gnl/MRDRNA2_/MRDRNA2_35719_c0~~gnl/MRDRNA2_/MRDRNA2_35719_c0_seq1.p1  ORF type:complete len:410 (-),score=35.18 gnl/MRDRNA2_/MRDRNA2_35719_c0_seq1:332-1525(-)
MATSGLATAFSVGSMIEIFISPYFGRFSDRYGRKPLLLSFLVGPTLMRTLCVLIKHPMTRIRLLWLDFVSVRTIGVQPTQAVVSTMISDVVPVASQPRARAHVTAAISLGQILGTYWAGWWIEKNGAESVFKIIAGIPAMAFALLACKLPETHPDLKRNAGHPRAKLGDASASPEKQKDVVAQPSKHKATSTTRAILRDRECLLLAVTLSLYEFMQYPLLSTMATLFMKDRFGWGPLQAGRFSSAFGVAVFVGSTCAGRLVELLGPRRHVTFAHCCTCLAYFLWGTATSGKAAYASLLPLAMGKGADTVLMTEFVKRASSLGYGKGEAGAVIQALGAINRTIGPQLFMRLYLIAQSRKRHPGATFKLPVGTPLLLVTAVSLLQETLYQMLLRARSLR